MNKRKCELLTLRKPTRVDELIESVPKPRNAVPKHGLPLWEHLPLGAKLPVLHGPKRELVFTRDKIGRKLWQNANQNEFILSDPNCLDVTYEYDSLHDHHLRHFFMNKINRKRMFELGLITKQGDAICSLKDYNNYRRYLKRVHEDAINAERVKMEERDMERFLLRKARENEDRDLIMHARKRIRKAKMKHVNEMLAAERQARADKLLARSNRHATRLLTIAAKKEDDLVRRMQKAIAFQMKIDQRRQQAQAIERGRRIKSLRKWHDHEVERRKRETREKWTKIMEKEWNDYHHLELKVKSQLNRLERQKNLLEHYKKEMEIRAELRSKEVEYKRLKMEDKIMKIKAEKVRQLSEHTWTIKAMVKALCKAWEDRLHHKTAEEAKEEKCLIEKTIQLQIAEYKNKSEGKEVLAVLQGAKRKLDKLFGVPEPVTFAVDSLLNSSIFGYVKKRVELIIADTVNQAEEFKKQHEAAMREHRRKKLAAARAQQSDAAAVVTAGTTNERPATRRASIRPNADVIRSAVTSATASSTQMTSRSKTRSLMSAKTRSTTRTGTTFGSGTSLAKPQRLVSFGTIVTIDKLKEEASVAAKETIPEDTLLVKRTKDRPPTPVPSLTELVDAAFHDPVNVESLREADVERENLDHQLTEFSKKLVKLVLTKAEMKVEAKRKHLYRQLSNLVLDRELVVTRIAEAILYNEEPDLMELPEVDHISDVLAKDVIVKRAGHIFLTTLPSTSAQPAPKTSNSKIIKKLVLMD